jgi:UDP-N-acetyl-2-amino-2-deoxyglucuronate dehydrogenase
MSQLKFGLIGCGRIAQRHAEHIEKVGVLDAVCDIESQRAKDLAAKYGAKSYTSADEMLKAETKDCL